MIRTVKKWLGLGGTKVLPQSPTTEGEVTNSNSLSIERENIKDTPFTLVGTPKTGYWLTLGKHRLTKQFKTKKEVHKQLEQKDWNTLTAVMIAFIYDRKLIDEAYTKNLAIPPNEKSRELAKDLKHD